MGQDESFTAGLLPVFESPRDSVARRISVNSHTLRHTALSVLIAAGHDDYTVMEISGHSWTCMLARYTHSTTARKMDALEGLAASLGRKWAGDDQTPDGASDESSIPAGMLVDGARIELATSALRTQRSPS